MSIAFRFFLLPVSGVALILGPSAGDAAPPVKADFAQTLVRRALEHEIDGNLAKRQELLNWALKKDQEAAPTHWFLGELKYQDQWRDYRQIPPQEAKRPEVQEYRKLRKPKPQTAGEHLKLADWCRDHDLPLREQAHLIAALELSKNPNNVKLRARLGHQFVDGAWMSPVELAESLESAERIEAAAKKWRPRLEILTRQLQSPRKDLQEKAQQELLAIDDPDVLPALEAALSETSLKTAEVLVDVLSKLKLVEAGRSLARQAVLSPYVTIREAAAKNLRSRPPESYVPLLMESLHTPIQSQVRLFVGRSGVRLTHLLDSEAKDVRQLAELDSQVGFRRFPLILRGSGLAFGKGSSLVRAAWNQSEQNKYHRAIQTEVLEKQIQAYAQQRAVYLKNDQLKEWNDRIFASLQSATGLNLPNDHKKWWKWWENYNQLYTPDEKPIEYFVTDAREVVCSPIVIPVSCLTAGTPIWTDQGYVPVEKVQVGDLVLSQHPKSGELAYQPVLRTTVRPPTDVVTARFGKTEMTCTLGHTFWISGKGWLKMRDAAPGALFHTANGAAKLDELVEAKPLPAYNLVVADFHTYFVGQDMLLSHDPTFAEPLNNLVPGMED